MTVECSAWTRFDLGSEIKTQIDSIKAQIEEEKHIAKNNVNDGAAIEDFAPTLAGPTAIFSTHHPGSAEQAQVKHRNG